MHNLDSTYSEKASKGKKTKYLYPREDNPLSVYEPLHDPGASAATADVMAGTKMNYSTAYGTPAVITEMQFTPREVLFRHFHSLA